MSYAPNTNSGHGHVWERPDGVKARCGGPGMCTQCSADQADCLRSMGYGRPPPVVPAPLTPAEMQVLNTYNTEVARGLLHTRAWDTKMHELKERLDYHRRTA